MERTIPIRAYAPVTVGFSTFGAYVSLKVEDQIIELDRNEIRLIRKALKKASRELYRAPGE